MEPPVSDAVLISLIGTVGTVMTAVLALLVKVWFDVREQHKAMNSRLDQLLASHGRNEHAKGREEGRAEGKEESP